MNFRKIKKLLIGLIPTFILVVTFTLLALHAYYRDTPIAQAEMISENNCEVIGTVGQIVLVARCIDPETNRVIYANSIGWMEIDSD